MATSYSNPGGSGNRTALINVTGNFTPSGSTFSALVNGLSTNQFWYGATQTNQRMVFDFTAMGGPQIIDELRWTRSTASGGNWGIWQVYGSSDGTTLDAALGSPFAIDGTSGNSGDLANTTAYNYYILVSQAGTNFTGTPYILEIEFKIDLTPSDFPIFVNEGTLATTGFNTTLTPGLPASLSVGDLLIGIVSCTVAGATRTFTWPAGWTEIDSHSSSSTNSSVAYRIVDGTEVGGPAITWVGNTSGDAKLLHYMWNLPDEDAIGATDSDFNDASTTTWTAPSVTTLANKSLVLAIFTGGSFNSTVPTPDGWEEPDTNGGDESTIAVFRKEVATAGASGAISETKYSGHFASYVIEIRSLEGEGEDPGDPGDPPGGGQSAKRLFPSTPRLYPQPFALRLFPV